MIYIKYTFKNNHDNWAIYHQLNGMDYKLIISTNDKWRRNWSYNNFDMISIERIYNIQYLTPEEVDLHKLELL